MGGTTTSGGRQWRDDGRTVLWVDRSEQLAELVGDIGAGPLAVDSEADSLHNYREKVCLVQLSFDSVDALVDPLAGVDLSALAAPLGDPDVETILHGADYDVRLLGRDFGLRLRGLFDTMIAARLAGETAYGLSALLETHLGVRLDKRFQRADWSSRPLTEEMERYAVLDTRHLAELAGRLRSRLEELGRTQWAEEEFRRLEKVRWEGPRPDAEPWQRVKGLRKLPRSRWAVLREVASLREQTARERDVPPFRVLRDEVMIELASSCPGTRGELTRVRGLSGPWKSRSGTESLLAAIGRGLETDQAEWPRMPRAARPVPLTPDQEARFRRLRDARDALAAKIGLEPSVIAPRAVLENLVRARDDGIPPEDVPDLRLWQLQQLEEATGGQPGS